MQSNVLRILDNIKDSFNYQTSLDLLTSEHLYFTQTQHSTMIHIDGEESTRMNL